MWWHTIHLDHHSSAAAGSEGGGLDRRRAISPVSPSLHAAERVPPLIVGHKEQEVGPAGLRSAGAPLKKVIRYPPVHLHTGGLFYAGPQRSKERGLHEDCKSV